MSTEYDKYYQQENLFGEPYPELIAFYSTIQPKGKLLDLGCGQGRDAIAIAKLGYKVTGVDYSKVGIEQLNQIAKQANLPLKGVVGDIYEYSNFEAFDFILMDSMFHFGKRERKKEIALIKKIIKASKIGVLITFCVQKTGNKLEILKSIIADFKNLEIIHVVELIYEFEDKTANHSSKTKYEMITIKKL